MAGTPWHWIQSHIEACRQGLGLNGFGQIGDRSLFEQSSFNLGRLSISRLDVVHGQHFTNNSSMASPQVRLAEDQHTDEADLINRQELGKSVPDAWMPVTHDPALLIE